MEKKTISPNKAFALRISKLLAEKKISKYRLTKESGVTESAMRYIFNERNQSVNLTTVIRVASALDMTLAEFFDDPIFDFVNLQY